MKKRIDWFAVVAVCTVALWLCWGAIANAAPRVAGNALLIHSQDSGTFPTPGLMNFNGVIGDIDGGLWTQDGYRGWVRLCTDVNGLGCADAGTVKTVTGSAPIGVVHDGGGGYNVSLLPGYLTGILPIVATSDGGGGYAISFSASNFDAGLVKVITATLPVIATWDAGGGYDISLRFANCTGQYAALQYDAGFYCAQLPVTVSDAGPSSVTGDAPIRVVNDGGNGFAVSLTPGYITGILPVIATSDGGGGYAIGMSTAACTGTYAALQYDAGFYCSQLPIQIPDSGYVSVTGTAPIVVTADGGGGYNVGFDAGFTLYPITVTGTSPITVVPDGGGGFNVEVAFDQSLVWSTFCPYGVTCNDSPANSFLGWYTPTAGSHKAKRVECNATAAGTAGAGSLTIKVHDGSGDVGSCSIPCTTSRAAQHCNMSLFTMSTAVSYRAYFDSSGCSSVPANLWCNFPLETQVP